MVAGAPGKPKRETCRPNSSGMGASFWRAAAAGADEEHGRDECHRAGRGVHAGEALAGEALRDAGRLATAAR